MSADWRALRSETARRLDTLDERVGQTEASQKEFGIELGKVQETAQRVDSRMRQFDAFFRSLRELLATLGQASGSTSESRTREETPAPAAAASPAPLPTPPAL